MLTIASQSDYPVVKDKTLDLNDRHNLAVLRDWPGHLSIVCVALTVMKWFEGTGKVVLDWDVELFSYV